MSSSREVTAQKKKDVWEQAEDEFYTESYPSGSQPANNTHHRRPSRLALPLPSHTARRGSLLQGRTNKTGGRRKYSLANNTARGGGIGAGAGGGLTYTSTMAVDANGTTTNANDIQVSILPDLSEETILNERKTWEELLRIKAMPVPMAQKKLLKAQLTTLPKLRLKGWSHLKFSSRRSWKNFTLRLDHFKRHLTVLQQPVRTIELRCGTAIANVFLLIKWTLLLNFAMSLAMLIFVIAPYLIHDLTELTLGENAPSTADPVACNASDQGPALALIPGWKNDTTRVKKFLDCCQAMYEKDLKVPKTGLYGKLVDIVASVGLGNIEAWPIHFSYYHDSHLPFEALDITYPFHAAYVLTGCAILGCCLILLVHNVTGGVKEIIKLKEGEFYKYSNLVFSGWEHFTNDKIGADFKRRLLRNEMKAALRTEKKKITDLGKTRREKLKLFLLRFFVNVTVVVLVIFAGVLIFYLTQYYADTGKGSPEKEGIGRTDEDSKESTNQTSGLKSLLLSFSPALTVSFFNLIFPVLLTRLGKLEDHSREWEIALVLLRSLSIRLFSVYALAYSYSKDYYCTTLDGYCTQCNPNSSFSFLKNDEKPKVLEPRERCWEVVFASQVYKLVLTELAIKVVLTYIGDPIRRLIGRCFKNKVAAKIGTLSFNIVRHSLDIIYIQVLAWVSFYFAPFMPLATVFYCFLIFYIKKFGVLHNVNYVPDTFRTSRTLAVFMMAKILSFVTVLFAYAFIVGFSEPSKECGPFRGYPTAWTAVAEEFKQFPWVATVTGFFFPGVAVPFALILILLAYYYYSVAQANRSMVETLRHLLILEGHDKQYLFSKLNSLRQSGNAASGKQKAPALRKTIFKDPKLSKRLSQVSTADSWSNRRTRI